MNVPNIILFRRILKRFKSHPSARLQQATAKITFYSARGTESEEFFWTSTWSTYQVSCGCTSIILLNYLVNFTGPPKMEAYRQHLNESAQPGKQRGQTCCLRLLADIHRSLVSESHMVWREIIFVSQQSPKNQTGRQILKSWNPPWSCRMHEGPSIESKWWPKVGMVDGTRVRKMVEHTQRRSELRIGINKAT